ncbi:hypothetical protein [Bifidobacterium cuniculi]|uniref:Uncharacterized protein n=1 Tax=Bifidobacterium cuniculi TaxID=1688 RepID=A0A087B4H6_9BIFI|nr:hypothetical protein [Bifidobacterium cuniculi]KFI65926.1 hypothetical protein BCUN_0425 [Bifidobacterium cuniculi]
MTNLTEVQRETLEAERDALQERLPQLDKAVAEYRDELEAYRAIHQDALAAATPAGHDARLACQAIEDRLIAAHEAATGAAERISHITMVLAGLRPLDEDPCETDQAADWLGALADMPATAGEDTDRADLELAIRDQLIRTAASWINSLDGDLLDLRLRRADGYAETGLAVEIDTTAIATIVLDTIRAHAKETR